MIGKLGLIMVVVKDMDRSIAFYRDVLGLKLQFQSPEFSQFDAGNIHLGLHAESDRLKAHPTESAQFAFYVDNIEQAVAHLKAKGVHILRPPKQEDFGILSIFTDPDGYHVELCQLAAEGRSAA
ncbi:MAG TPA: VOC family protein [Terriglobales bacterium]|nr:VOC family protein [Terriglobales bacterium]